MVDNVKSLDDLLSSAQSLWDKEFKKHMDTDSQRKFSTAIATIIGTHQRQDYMACLSQAFEDYRGFLALTETAEANATGVHSFPMRDYFRGIFELVAREFIERRLAGKVAYTKEIGDTDRFLVINRVEGQFELVDGSTKFYLTKDGRETTTRPEVWIGEFRKPLSGVVVKFDNSGRVLEKSTLIYHGHERLEPNLTYRVKGSL